MGLGSASSTGMAPWGKNLQITDWFMTSDLGLGMAPWGEGPYRTQSGSWSLTCFYESAAKFAFGVWLLPLF